VPDVACHPRQKRGKHTAGNGCPETRVPRQRANAQYTALLTYIIEGVDAIDVDEVRWASEPKIHRRHETLAPGKDLSFIAVCSEKIERIVDGVGRKIFKRDGFHWG
jgi:hypothetical protein